MALDTYPAWIGRVLQETAPAGLSLRAVYYSWAARMPGRAIAVADHSLVLWSFNFTEQSNNVLGVQVLVIDRRDVRIVEIKTRVQAGVASFAAAESGQDRMNCATTSICSRATRPSTVTVSRCL
jgi:hypothetical protein